jgi:hypothetical protein
MSRAPTALDGARDAACQDNYGEAGLAAAEAAGLASAELAIAAGLASDAAEADASGAGALSSDLLQAAAVKNIVTSSRSRTLRIASSFNSSFQQGAKARNETKNTIAVG